MAACDPAGVLAYPYATIPAGEHELAAIVAVVTELAPREVIVGLPRSLSGADGPAARQNRERALGLARALASVGQEVAVRLVDERLTTVTAARQLRASGRRAKDQRTVIDAAAAVAILEHALASERARGAPPGELVSPPEVPAKPAPDPGRPDTRSGELP